MSDTHANHENGFTYERALKIIQPFVDEQSLELLVQWKISADALHNAWCELRISQSNQTVNRLKLRMNALIDMADQIHAVLSTIFMNIPHPQTASHIWDAGRKKSSILARERAIEMIGQYINSCYETLWKRLEQIQPLIDCRSEPTDSDIECESSAQTPERQQEEINHHEPAQMKDIDTQESPLTNSDPVPDKTVDAESVKSGNRLIYHDDDFI
ncbi:hypothetical protein [Gynuella sunshinyii]|uniref:Uncharacterized protein n=1 Tax=Gynuella sunshinyii YC6258 TaxID=1445510 RepID=A0A0C5VPC3_9GAMM|nr:hypothetical protein [Gynuella sunshinyii]AJQ92109.1 hypothetical Protein YC6258_00053 [Gynuella sunshinyii YC6258]